MSATVDSCLLDVDVEVTALVPAVLDGRSMLLGFKADPAEHSRRQSLGVGAVDSRRALHVLWTLPHGISWPAAAIDEIDRATLQDEGPGLVGGDETTIVRLYQPAGTVELVAVTTRRLGDAIRAVAAMPPIFRRFAIGMGVDDVALDAARELGVGAIRVKGADAELLADPGLVQVGAPGVYRWWIAEVAYRNWLQTNVH